MMNSQNPIYLNLSNKKISNQINHLIIISREREKEFLDSVIEVFFFFLILTKLLFCNHKLFFFYMLMASRDLRKKQHWEKVNLRQLHVLIMCLFLDFHAMHRGFNNYRYTKMAKPKKFSISFQYFYLRKSQYN